MALSKDLIRINEMLQGSHKYGHCFNLVIDKLIVSYRM